MTLLTIGSDRLLFRPSAARERVASYGSLFEEMLIVVFTKRLFKETQIAENVRVYPTKSLAKFFYIIDALGVGSRIIRRLPAEKKRSLIISAQDPFESGLVAFLLARKFGARLHIQVHTDLFSPYFGARILNRMRVQLARFLLARAHCIRVVSERIKRSLAGALRISADRITVLPIQNALQFVSSSGNSESEDSGKNLRILTVARLEPEKGVDISIRAFARYIELGGSGDLNIVGDGSQRESLEALARDLNVTDRVAFRGWAEDVSTYYTSADCFLMTSWYEGWGVAAADAISFGVPVVMTDVGLAGEAVLDGINGLIAPVGDVIGLAERLLRLERDEALYAKLAAVAKSSPQESYETYLERHRRAFERCMQ